MDEAGDKEKGNEIEMGWRWEREGVGEIEERGREIKTKLNKRKVICGMEERDVASKIKGGLWAHNPQV